MDGRDTGTGGRQPMGLRDVLQSGGAGAVIIFRSDMCVMIHRMVRNLVSFQHRVARHITGSCPNQREDGSWEYPPLETAI